MNIEQLKYVLEISREGSILSAAEKLFMTQSALSQSITSLENELGMTIFNRSRAGCTLTSSGKKVVPIFNNIIDNVKELKELEQIPYSSMLGNVKIAMSNFAFMSFLPNVIRTFRNTFPNISVEINDLHMTSVINEILSGSSDFGMILLNDALLSEYKKNFNCNVLCSSTLKVCVSKKSPLAKRERVSITDLLDYSWVLSNKSLTESFKKTIPEFNDAQVLFYSNNANLISNAVASNVAITFLTDISIQLNPVLTYEGIVSIPLEKDSYNMHFLLIYSKNKYLTIPEREFINNMKFQILESIESFE